ncbi:MAG: Bug family tripartite tricarboxylate transporter substrate binding protein [Acetobacteraceae bacterium]
MLSRRFMMGGSAAAAVAGAGSAAQAQSADNWPTKVVKIIVNFAPGGSTDNAMRPFADRLSRVLGQQFIIDNRGGASGALGLEAAVRSAPDGYTFVATPSLTVTVLPNLRKLPFDLFKDLKPVSRFTDATLLFAVHPSVPANTIPEFVEYAKKNPGKLSWGTAGIGSQGHMMCEAFKSAAGVDILHVPYKGGGESLSDFLAGVHQIHADANTFPHLAQKKGKLLAVLDRQRHPDYPDVPLLQEFYPEIDFYAWFGLYAPAGTPDPIIGKLAATMGKIAQEPDLIAQFRKLALRPNPSSPEELAKTMRSDYDQYAALVKKLNMKPE